MSSTGTHAFADTPDQLSRASYYARLLRNAPDPEVALAEVRRRFDIPAVLEPAAASFVRLALAPFELHAQIVAFIKTLVRAQVVNRATALAPALERLPADAEAERLREYVGADTSRAVALFEHPPAFMLLERRVTLPSQQLEEFPRGTRLLLDYPLDAARLFPITCGCEYVDVCEAIADAYDWVYSAPRANGVTLHDLSDLVVERIYFFPDEKLVYPHIGS